LDWIKEIKEKEKRQIWNLIINKLWIIFLYKIIRFLS
jgi:hypothetical protein